MHTDKEVLCPICFSVYDEPTSLKCSHAFCKACLGRLLQTQNEPAALSCPICEEVTPVSGGDVGTLAKETRLMSLVMDARSRSQTCSSCKMKLSDRATTVAYCQECGVYMCEACRKIHEEWGQFSRHTVVGMSEILSEQVSLRRRKCAKHPLEDEELFCLDCGRYVCFKCGVMEHERKEKHQVIQGTEHESKTQDEGHAMMSSAKGKNATIATYTDFVKTQRQKLGVIMERLTKDIESAYEDSVQCLTERRDALKDELNMKIKEIDRELSAMEEKGKCQLNRADAVSDLIGKGLDLPLEREALQVQRNLYRRMEDILSLEDPDFTGAEKTIGRGEELRFLRSEETSGLEIGKISIGQEGWLKVNEVQFSNKNSMTDMTSTPEGGVAVTCCPGGVEVYNSDGEQQLTTLDAEDVVAVAYLSDGRSVVRDTSNNILLYTTDGEREDTKFETIGETEGGHGGVSVDGEDRIYVTYRKAKKIQIFSASGGKEVGMIAFVNFEPIRAFPLKSMRRVVVKSSNNAIRLIDDCGVLIRECVSMDRHIYAFPAIYRNDEILVAWVKCLEGKVTIEHYSSDLKPMKTVIVDQEVPKSKRKWYALQSFGDGRIALSTSSKLLIFNKLYI